MERTNGSRVIYTAPMEADGADIIGLLQEGEFTSFYALDAREREELQAEVDAYVRFLHRDFMRRCSEMIAAMEADCAELF